MFISNFHTPADHPICDTNAFYFLARFLASLLNCSSIKIEIKESTVTGASHNDNEKEMDHDI